LKNCPKEAKILEFIATNNPMWRALEVDTCLFFAKSWFAFV
jgi:hypothetical protein